MDGEANRCGAGAPVPTCATVTQVPAFLPSGDDARDVAAKFGTPAYVYDEATLRGLAARVTSFAAPFGLVPRYAVKANSCRAVLRLFDEAGLSFDASTVWEARRVVAAGVAASKVQITSQWLAEGFEGLVRAGARVTACSVEQLVRFGIAFPRGECGVRINPGRGSGANTKTSVAGPAASFGIWYEHLDDVHEVARQFGLRIRWAHHHVGSGGDPAKWAHIAESTLRHVERLPDVGTVNLGGGFKVARVAGETASDLAAASREASALLTGFAERTGRRLRLEIEPGTFLTANAGAIVARVIDVVETGRKGHVFVKLDAGMAEILRPSLYGAQHPISFVAARAAMSLGESRPLLVVGPCCESGDLLTPQPAHPEGLGERVLPQPRIGDLAVVGGAGAYCAAMAARNYNSIPAAPEVMRRADGSFALARRRQTLEDVLREEV
jgi:diaminopimelate decarboxylase